MVSEALNMEQAAFEYRKVLKRDELARGSAVGPLLTSDAERSGSPASSGTRVGGGPQSCRQSATADDPIVGATLGCEEEQGKASRPLEAAVPLEQLVLDDYRHEITPESLPLLLIRDQMAGEAGSERKVGPI